MLDLLAAVALEAAHAAACTVDVAVKWKGPVNAGRSSEMPLLQQQSSAAPHTHSWARLTTAGCWHRPGMAHNLAPPTAIHALAAGYRLGTGWPHFRVPGSLPKAASSSTCLCAQQSQPVPCMNHERSEQSQ